MIVSLQRYLTYLKEFTQCDEASLFIFFFDSPSWPSLSFYIHVFHIIIFVFG